MLLVKEQLSTFPCPSQLVMVLTPILFFLRVRLCKSALVLSRPRERWELGLIDLWFGLKLHPLSVS